MNIKRNSWHYKLLAFSTVVRNLDRRNYNDILKLRQGGKSFVEIYEDRTHFWSDYYFKLPTNSCQYIRNAVILPISYIFLNLAFLIGLISLISYVLFMYPLSVVMGIGYFIAAAALVIAILGVLFIASTKSKAFIKAFVQNSDNTITNTIYTNYKDKICTIVKVEDK